MKIGERKKVGILGGTFNPIHFGHLLLAESARDRLQLDKVLFIPTGTNPYKQDIEDVGSEHRYNMTKLGIASNPNFEISKIEMEREGYTYTIDTLKELDQIYEDTDFYFISGADIIFEIHKWKDAKVVLQKLKIVTTFRPGYDDQCLIQRIKELNENYGANITNLDTLEIDVSSSEIRSRIAEGFSIQYLLPESVRDYICDNKLYALSSKL